MLRQPQIAALFRPAFCQCFPVYSVAAVTKIAQLSWFFYWSGRACVIHWASCQFSGGKTLSWGDRNFLSQCNSITYSSPLSKNQAGSPCCSPTSLNSGQCSINTLHLVLQFCNDKYIYYEAATYLIFRKLVALVSYPFFFFKSPWAELVKLLSTKRSHINSQHMLPPAELASCAL